LFSGGTKKRCIGGTHPYGEKDSQQAGKDMAKYLPLFFTVERSKALHNETTPCANATRGQNEEKEIRKSARDWAIGVIGGKTGRTDPSLLHTNSGRSVGFDATCKVEQKR